jgi:site-specific recombinase XerC
MRPKPSGRFALREITVKKRLDGQPVEYSTFLLSGWRQGTRYRRQFKSRELALGEKNALEVEAANAGGEIRARNTRLSAAQLAEAEAAIGRLGTQSIALAVEWFLTTYRPPITAMALESAVAAFLKAKAAHVRPLALRDYRCTLTALQAAFPARVVHSIATADLQSFLANRGVGKKRLNNLRGDLNAFFVFCQSAPREWIRENPVKPIQKYKIARGIPEVMAADTAARLMAYVESYSGGPKTKQPPGFLAPYFALCLFAGLRPSVPDGEACKLGLQANPGRFIDQELSVIRIMPEVAKTNSVRQVTIQPNLAEWLMRYPLAKFPIVPRNAKRWITAVRVKFGIGEDVLRHSFISMHVAKFKSLGAAALEAGNSETMIRRHYLNLVCEADANGFWSITPGMDVGTVTELDARQA